MTYTINDLGGSRYKVKYDNGNYATIDIDGIIVVSNEDYIKIRKYGLDTFGYFAPMHHEGNKEWKLVAEHLIETNPFDVDLHIMEAQLELAILEIEAMECTEAERAFLLEVVKTLKEPQSQNWKAWLEDRTVTFYEGLAYVEISGNKTKTGNPVCIDIL